MMDNFNGKVVLISIASLCLTVLALTNLFYVKTYPSFNELHKLSGVVKEFYCEGDRYGDKFRFSLKTGERVDIRDVYIDCNIIKEKLNINNYQIDVWVDPLGSLYVGYTFKLGEFTFPAQNLGREIKKLNILSIIMIIVAIGLINIVRLEFSNNQDT